MHGPESGLLLLSAGQFPDGLIGGDLKGRLQFLETGGIESGIDPPVKPGHVRRGGLGEEEHFIGNVSDAFLDVIVFVYRASVDGHLAGVRPVDAREMTDDGGFAGAVGADEAVDGSVRHVHIELIERGKAVKTLDHVDCFDHFASPPSSLRCRISSSSDTPRNLSSRTARSRSSHLRRSSSPEISREGLTKLPLPGML